MSNNRRNEIAREILRACVDFDGTPAAEAVIHAAVNNRIAPDALLSEFDAALEFCERERWITGVRNQLKGTLWAVTDRGRAALDG